MRICRCRYSSDHGVCVLTQFNAASAPPVQLFHGLAFPQFLSSAASLERMPNGTRWREIVCHRCRLALTLPVYQNPVVSVADGVAVSYGQATCSPIAQRPGARCSPLCFCALCLEERRYTGTKTADPPIIAVAPRWFMRARRSLQDKLRRPSIVLLLDDPFLRYQ